jgi:hypothetical protein
MNSSRSTTLRRLRTAVSISVAVLGLAAGMYAPAMALTRSDSNQDFTEGTGGNESDRWTDATPGYADSRVTVSEGCNRDFTVTIRQDMGGRPDPDRGHEWINCTSYTDAVYANDSVNHAKRHHYDGTDIGYVSVKPYVPKHARFNAVVRW